MFKKRKNHTPEENTAMNVFDNMLPAEAAETPAPSAEPVLSAPELHPEMAEDGALPAQADTGDFPAMQADISEPDVPAAPVLQEKTTAEEPPFSV